MLRLMRRRGCARRRRGQACAEPPDSPLRPPTTTGRHRLLPSSSSSSPQREGPNAALAAARLPSERRTARVAISDIHPKVPEMPRGGSRDRLSPAPGAPCARLVVR